MPTITIISDISSVDGLYLLPFQQRLEIILHNFRKVFIFPFFFFASYYVPSVPFSFFIGIDGQTSDVLYWKIGQNYKHDIQAFLGRFSRSILYSRIIYDIFYEQSNRKSVKDLLPACSAACPHGDQLNSAEKGDLDGNWLVRWAFDIQPQRHSINNLESCYISR